MDFKTAVEDCLAIHKRSDKIPVTKLAINTAIADLMRHDKFSFDLYQLDYVVPASSQRATMHHLTRADFGEVQPRIIESITTAVDVRPLLKVKPEQLARPGTPKAGVFYARSDGYMLNLRAATSLIKVSYYAKPVRLVEDTDTHWTLQQAHEAVVQRALAIVFASVGEDRDANVYRSLSAESFARLALDLE